MAALGKYALRLPAGLLEETRKLAEKEGISINSIIVSALSAKLVALSGTAFFQERSARADLGVFDRILAAAGSEPPQDGDEIPVAPPGPAVPIKASVTPDYIVCLEDGKRLKLLKRHLRALYGMTPEQYRAKWRLPADYPMVAPNYAKRRAAVARQLGFRKGAEDRRTSES